MSGSEPQFRPWLALLQEHFREQRYSWGAAQNYPYAVRRFLRDLGRRGQVVESVSPTDVENYLDGLRLRRHRGQSLEHSRRMHRAAIRMLLRLIHGEWPPEVMPTTVHALAQREVIIAYDAWMTQLRGLSASTRRGARAETYRLLQWVRDERLLHTNCQQLAAPCAV